MPKKSRILVAPLDWGMGHTTRCLPLIHYLIEKGCEVYLAAEGNAAAILRSHFPALPILPLKGYRIHYSHKPALFMPRLLAQIPKIFGRIRAERQWLEQQQKQYHFDAVISDNRYGLYHKSCPSVIMTHQVQILSGSGVWADRILLKWHRRRLEKFNDCWIVDQQDNGLSGILAHPPELPVNATYIGLLSQLMMQALPTPSEKHCLVLLSGPEPMRTQLEQLLWEQCIDLKDYNFVFVAGNPNGPERKEVPTHIHYYAYLGGVELQQAMAEAAIVVCRSGYSTLMDLACLQKKAILIPTPGQTEQQYLAAHLQAGGNYETARQQSVQLATILPALWNKPYDPSKAVSALPVFPKVLDEWLDR